jgi:hypothetical protein
LFEGYLDSPTVYPLILWGTLTLKAAYTRSGFYDLVVAYLWVFILWVFKGDIVISPFTLILFIKSEVGRGVAYSLAFI